MAMPLRPLHFLSREDGTLTALIAVDELPHYVSIRGVPRTLNHSDTQGMTSLGTVKSRGQFYLLDNAIQHASKAGGEKPNNPNYSLVAGRGPDGYGQFAIDLQNSILDSQVVENPEYTTVNASGQQLAKNNSGNRSSKGNQNGNATKKEYCSFWLRHGECDYQQQGCIFKHEMPTDKPTLDKLGLRAIPRWYREKHGVKGVGGSGNGRTRHEGNGRFWRAENHHHPISSHGDRRDIHGNHLVTTGIPEEKFRTTPTPSQHASAPGISHSHQAIYNCVPVPLRPLHQGMSTPGGTNTNIAASNSSLGAPKVANRCDLISIDDLRKSPTPEHMAQARANAGFGKFVGQHPHGRPDLMDYPSANGPGPSVRGNGSNESKALDAGSHNGVMLPRNYGPVPMQMPGTNSLWAMGENDGDSWNTMPLTPFQSAIGTPTNQSNGQGAQLKKKTQRSRRLYQRRQSLDGLDATDEEKNLRTMSVSPINTGVPTHDLKGAAPGAISPCLSPHPPSGSYTSSPCSPRSGHTASRLSDNLDFRGNGNHRYASRGSPNSTESTNTNNNGGATCDLFDLGLNNPITLGARQA
ncbi:C-x8-C-x5-C-x3-H type zinc finger protein [Arthroderma uncinatum]|uniref:C-x8-C-x5-C-x3-H type zinc finger protein n=1 Tax=Arthroderma uncinatum TaxID=74035 RepID=UPI00144AD1E2|nr:C-x8-C-x5-C-x3-H type zinc finger protein [Arthroderma uncinatum]KAF3491763.1 C-x8-C-x5-C-x3-H type zinc finger protein [Arthroderma uncinatum]